VSFTTLTNPSQTFNVSLHRPPPSEPVPSNVHNHHQSLSTELDRLLQQTELESIHSSPLPIEATSPLLLLEFLCEDLGAVGDEFPHEKYQRVQTLLQFWNEKPVIGTLWTIGGGTPIGISSENETLLGGEPSDYHSPPLPNLNPSAPSKNHFDLEPLEELTLAKPLRTPTNPYLPEHADIQSEDISLGHATLNLHHTLASLTDLYQPLRPLLGPLARPTPSALFQIQTPVQLTAEQAIERSYQDSIDRLREPPRTHLLPTPRTRVFTDYIRQPCHLAAAEAATEYQTTQTRTVVLKRKDPSTPQNPRRSKKRARRRFPRN
jgi:hypothetical protein